MQRNARPAARNLRRPRVALVVPFLSEFRRAFYERLEADLDTRGITLVVAHGDPYSRDQSTRHDIIRMDRAVHLRQRSATVAGRPLVHKRLGPLIRTSDALVVDQALRNLELYPLLLRQFAGRGPVVAMWDHGRTFHRPQSAVEQSLKFALTRRARWFFAYTESGARAVTDNGFAADRVTVVQNAIDTTALAQAYERVTEDQLAEFRAKHGLRAGRTALYVGALSTTKRIPFLLNAAERVAQLVPGFKLLVAGTGQDKHLVAAATARPDSPVVAVGPAFGADKALLGAASDVLLMPGLVGLAIVDSFVLRAPLVTTATRWHGPEFEYLEHGRNGIVAPSTPESYAQAVADLLGDPDRHAAMQRQCAADARKYTIEEMSRRFADGVVHMLAAEGVIR